MLLTRTQVSVSTRTSSTGFSQETSILQRLAQQHRPIEAELTRAATSAVALTNVLPPRADPPPVTHAVASILAALQSSSSLVTVLLRTGRTSPSLASCLSTLRHTVVIVRGLKTEDLILDPCFRSQFVIPHAPPAYHEFLNTHVPAVLVGDAAHVHAVVSAVSSAIATVYKCTLDNTVPPWRKHSALLSKFVPSAFDDVVVDGAQSVASVLVGIDHVDAHETRTIAGALVDGMAKVLRDKRRLVDGGVSPRTVFLQEAVAAV